MLDNILALYQSTVIMTAPLLLTSLGGLITYHTGTINVAMEGLMLAGSFAAVCFPIFSPMPGWVSWQP
jgi:simple sugar transport system permease protein